MRLKKLSHSVRSMRSLWALLRHRVLVGAEHRHVLSCNLATVVDIGANRGQFSLAVRQWAPMARIISFEPLPAPAAVFRMVFSTDTKVVLHEVAVGPRTEQGLMHVSARDDSSSLLPISTLQHEIFPGTDEVSRQAVTVAPLESVVAGATIQTPAMLKLDVQGYEYETLAGCESLLSRFDFVYCECSFVELYSGQKMAADVIQWLGDRGFQLRGIYNPAYDHAGQAVQADFLFTRSNIIDRT